MPAAQLTWLDLTATDRDKVRQVLTLFNEQGTVDELGLGSLRDLLSNTLFPGLSVLHTRLRYVLFVPWIYQQVEALGLGHEPIQAGRERELQLIDTLAASDDTRGIIGIMARQSLSRLASTAYWALIAHLGIFVPEHSQGWYHAQFDRLVRKRGDVPRADDPGVIWSQTPTWHPRLPPAQAGFPGKASFALSFEEADFIRGRIEERSPGTLLSWLAREGSPQLAARLWEEPLVDALPQAIAHHVELARRFSLHVEGAPLLYNLMLAEARHLLQPSDADRKLIDDYHARIVAWAALEADEEPFDPIVLWDQAARSGLRVPSQQQHFVETWTRRVNQVGPHDIADDPALRQLITIRELRLKGQHRARLSNNGRLLDWSGDVGTGRMVFRWPQTRQMLIDLHQGLAR